jgi:diguanylate cyclase (GGDEF)-like protein/PAS domain S-box-containing protein
MPINLLMDRQDSPRLHVADPAKLVDQLMNDAVMGLTAIDTQFNFSFVNTAFANSLGRTPEEMIGTKCFDYVLLEDMQAMADSAAQLEVAAAGIIPVPTPFRGLHADGHHVPLEVWLQSVDRTGSPYHMVFAHRSAEPIDAIDRFVESTIDGSGLDVSFAALAQSVEATFPCDVLIYWGWDGRTFHNVIGNDLGYVEHQWVKTHAIDLSPPPIPTFPQTALSQTIESGKLIEHVSFLDYPEAVRRHAQKRNAFACQVLAMRYQSDMACIVMWNRQRTPVEQDHHRAGIGARLILERTAKLGTLALQRWSTDERVAREMRTDSLTQIMNRYGFVEELASVWEHKEDAWLLLIDVDRFKSVNDQYGHLTGDALLRELAQRFCSVVSSRDVVARLGGDEFAILIRANTRAEDRVNPDERIGTLVETLHGIASHPVLINGQIVRTAISIGAAKLGDNEQPMTAMGIADRAMYANKQQRRASLGTSAGDLSLIELGLATS